MVGVGVFPYGPRFKLLRRWGLLLWDDRGGAVVVRLFYLINNRIYYGASTTTMYT